MPHVVAVPRVLLSLLDSPVCWCFTVFDEEHNVHLLRTEHVSPRLRPLCSKYAPTMLLFCFRKHLYDAKIIASVLDTTVY